MLAILLPQAWRVLLLRSLSDEAPDASWRAAIEPLAFTLLKLEMAEALPGGSRSSEGGSGWPTSPEAPDFCSNSRHDNPVRCHVPDRPGLAELRMSRLRSAGVAHLRLANPPTSPRTPDRGSASAIEGANTESDSSRATCRPHSCSR